jgi:glycosyltransferase involved in cell wall biosynthesis
MIKVVHVIAQIGIGGAETQLCKFIANSDPQTLQHEVLYFSDSNDQQGYKLYDENRINYVRVPRNKKRPLKFISDLSHEIKKRNPDIVHCWLFSANIWGRWAAIKAGCSHIILAYRNCSLPYALLLRQQDRFFSDRLHYFANSLACATFIARRLKIPKEKFTVIYNGLEIEKFEMPAQRDDLFGHLGIPTDASIVTMVGRLFPQKNYPMLLQVARKCKDEKYNIHFLIAGTGPKEVELKTLCTELQIEDIVHFIGLRRDIPRVLLASDIFCFTSRFEGFPNALLEAMAAELPIITTNFDGADELITDGQNGRMIEIDDVDACMEAIKFYLENPENAKLFGQSARKFVDENCTIQRMVQSTTRYYHGILSGDNR